MEEAATTLQATQVDDRFEIIPRGPSWRVRCLDCPGKVFFFHFESYCHESWTDSFSHAVMIQLYNLGPGETMENFSVHFKNRKHRSNVDERLASMI